ncbi:MAG TPA: hypothetical protein PLL76_19425 [Thermoanaerobaculia bacterium]|jgi:hypothetical protein|nr:hypothetical protein [Thermoanaerobaculia bacterium]HQP88426.1 hypothetical protein [Thermoanaerobaculia bacterium]
MTETTERTSFSRPALDALAAGAEVRLNLVGPASGWDSWTGAVLHELLIAGVGSGEIDGDVGTQAAEHVVDRRPLNGLLDTAEFVHDLAFRLPMLEASLRPVRARIIEYVEPLVAEQAATAIRGGRLDAASLLVQRFLELSVRFAEGHVEPALLANAFERLLNGGER